MPQFLKRCLRIYGSKCRTLSSNTSPSWQTFPFFVRSFYMKSQNRLPPKVYKYEISSDRLNKNKTCTNDGKTWAEIDNLGKGHRRGVCHMWREPSVTITQNN